MGSSNSLFIQLAIVLGLSASIGYLVKVFKLPLIVAYLLAGVFLSGIQLFPAVTNLLGIEQFHALGHLPEVGIAFVLFFVGMELDLKEIKTLGKPIIASSIVQIFFSILAGILIATTLGFNLIESFYLGVGLSFSSTIVVVKMLFEKKDLSSLYGKLSLGILLIEDLAAIILLMMMTVGSSALNLGLQSNLPLVTLIVKGIGLILISIIFSKYALNSMFKATASSAELLFLTALSWCFIFVALALLMGFSVVIGAFLAGVALANSPFHYEIQGKVKPLRDFFVTLFFVYLGSQVTFLEIGSALPIIIIFTLYAVLVKPVVFLLVLGAFGFKKHTIFKTALNLSQVSEFSLIILVVGVSQGIVSSVSLTAMALTGVISIIISSILIHRSKPLYRYLKSFISIFEHGKFLHESEMDKKDIDIADHVILIGGHRVGSQIINFLQKEDIPFLVLDFNPKVVANLSAKKIHALYGDIGDPEILEFLNLDQAKLVICTSQDEDDNLMLLSEVKRQRSDAVIITRATSISEAEKLYKAGSDYVILPETITGDFLTSILKSHWPSLDFFKDRSNIELSRLLKNSFSSTT
jgi:Kef-type K+ transport system membrane component KefB